MSTTCNRHDTRLCVRCIEWSWICSVLWRTDWQQAIQLFYPEAKA